MAAIDFPASPSTNQTHTASGITWTWDGTSWKAQGSTTTYTLPTASSGTLGGIKVGGNFAIDGAGTLSLSAAAISGLSDVTATNADYLMLWDATDSSLKKVDAGELIGGGGGGSGITVQDEGSSLSTAGTTLNFVGSGVVASGTGSTKTITISGGGGSIAGINTLATSHFNHLNIAGLSTFTGIGTFSNDLYVAGDLSVLGSTNLNSQTLNVNRVNITGFTTHTGITTYSNHVNFGGLNKKVTFFGHSNLVDQKMYWDTSSNGSLHFAPGVHSYYGGTRTHIDPHGTGSAGHFRIEQYMDEGDNPLKVHSDFVGLVGSPTGGHEGRDIAKFEYREGTILYYTDTKRFQTSGIGVTVYGELDATSADIDDFLDVGSNIQLGNAGVATATLFNATTGVFAPYADIDDWIDVGSNIKLGNAGVITATSYAGSGANLTALNASNLGSGTVAIARLGSSGTADNSTFLRGDGAWATPTGGGGSATTINNNADNRIITGSASANTLNAESSLSYDGNNLNFANDKKITFGNNLRMQIYTDGSDNFIKLPADGSGAFPLTIFSSAIEALKINSSGNIIIGGSLDAELAYDTAWTLGASGTSHYTFTGNGLDGAENDPTIYVTRGQKYAFKNRSGGHPFRIQTSFQNTSGTAYNDGVTNNSAGNGTDLIWNVQFDAPDVLYYQCTAHTNMSGKIVVLGGDTGRTTTSATTGSIAQAAYADITIPTTGKTFALLKIAISAPAWVVLYSDTSSRTSDAAGTGSGRSEGTDPTPGSGVLAEVSTTTSGASTFKMTPGLIGWNDDGTPAAQIYARVYNKRATSGSNTITVTLTSVIMEV